MGTPLFAFDALFTPLQRLARVVTRRCSRARRPAVASVPAAATPPLHAAVAASAPRRLRVVRVIERSQGAAASAGRMVISGRMADVCAELDRLAALEAAAG